jgi:flavodoxin I
MINRFFKAFSSWRAPLHNSQGITVKTALIYGTCTGNTEHVAGLIKEALMPEIEMETVDVFKIKPDQLNDWDFVICGIPTWDVGELEYGWSDIYDHLDEVELNVTVAMFGLGDQGTYAETYQDAMGILYEKLIERGATGGVGFTDTESHEFDDSRAVIDGKFCGLAVDEDMQRDLTDLRITAWAEGLKKSWPEILEKVAAQAS